MDYIPELVLISGVHSGNKTITSFIPSPSLFSRRSLCTKKIRRAFYLNKEASENGQRGILTVRLIPSPRCHPWSFCEKAVQD